MTEVREKKHVDDSPEENREERDRDRSAVRTSRSPAPGTTTVISGDVYPGATKHVSAFFTAVGASISRLRGEWSESPDFYSDMLRELIKVKSIERGRLTCLFSVVPGILNTFDGLHGGLVAMMAERVGKACAMTVVAKNEELFLAELSLSYLSAASLNDELEVESSVAKTGRNVTVVTIEIRKKLNRKLLYLSHAVFFHGSLTAKL